MPKEAVGLPAWLRPADTWRSTGEAFIPRQLEGFARDLSPQPRQLLLLQPQLLPDTKLLKCFFQSRELSPDASFHRIGSVGKDILRSWSPTINSTPSWPLRRVLQCHVYLSVLTDLLHFMAGIHFHSWALISSSSPLLPFHFLLPVSCHSWSSTAAAVQEWQGCLKQPYPCFCPSERRQETDGRP